MSGLARSQFPRHTSPDLPGKIDHGVRAQLRHREFSGSVGCTKVLEFQIRLVIRSHLSGWISSQYANAEACNRAVRIIQEMNSNAIARSRQSSDHHLAAVQAHEPFLIG